MFKVLEFSKEGSFLSLQRGFLEVKAKDDQKHLVVLDDVGSIVFSGYGQTVTTTLLRELLERDVALTFCDEKFMPLGLLLPHFSSGQLNKRIHAQIGQTVPFKKSIWKEIVSKKIYFQGEILKYYIGDDEGLLALSKSVQSGDAGNLEAQAAKRYWAKLFRDFKRGDGDNVINALLNYGYIVLRSTVSRSIVAQGLHPSFGIFHNNKENNFCLADDFIEVFRPVIDFRVRKLYENEENIEELTPRIKKFLAESIYEDLMLEDGKISPLYQCVEKIVASYVNSIEEKRNLLIFPKSALPTK